tara:strand:+ start:5272 stop:6024 length:753 start_codon:yes stop_codon:yes gene_type:complete
MRQLNRQLIERYSRQIILKKVGIQGQKSIMKSKVLIVGAGGLGCPVADYLCRAGVGNLGIVDFDKVTLSNLHRQTLFSSKDIGKLKVNILKKKLQLVNPSIKIKTINKKINSKNIEKIIEKFDIIVDGTDNFKAKFLINSFALKSKKILIVGAISKFDGHVFVFDFKNKKEPCLKCFYQSEPSDEILNCETEGIIGTVAGVIGNIQANEVIKKILNLKTNNRGKIFIFNLENLSLRKVDFFKRKNCLCSK